MVLMHGEISGPIRIWTVLILLDKDKVTFDDQKRISYPLYDVEFDTGQMISPLIKSKREWYSKYKITPFFKSVTSEGIVL
jgi:hypothetical protein